MPTSTFELPKIPASAIMELRSRGALTAAHRESLQSPHIHDFHKAIGVTCIRQSYDPVAFATGMQIAAVLGDRFDDTVLNDRHVTRAKEVVTREFLLRTLDPESRVDTLAECLSELETKADGTVRAIDRIAVPYVEGDMDSLHVLRQGAAAVRLASHQVKLNVGRFEKEKTPPYITLVARSVQDL